MGVYCNLYIGSAERSWKGVIPDIISLLFLPSDYVGELNQDEGWCEHKFVSTCGRARARLNTIGIDIEFIKELHFKFFAFDFQRYQEDLEYRCQSYLNDDDRGPRVPKQTVGRMVRLLLKFYFKPLNQDEEFAKVLNHFVCTDEKNKDDERSDTSLEQPILGDKTSTADILAGFSRKYLKEFLSEDPYLKHLEDEFGDVDSGSPDLDNLYFIALSIFASQPDVPIEFHFSEFIDSNTAMPAKEVKELFQELIGYLSSRTLLATKAFGAIGSLDKGTADRATVVSVSKFRGSKEKGEYLEHLVRSIFVEQEGLKVKMNVKHPGEEIDLVILNKLSNPFWTSIQSPMILVECKNQKKVVQPKDIRNFEVKILDRRGMCKLGMIVSISGFTKNCFEATSRLRREGYNILLIDKKDLNARVADYSTTVDWLEDLIVQQC